MKIAVAGGTGFVGKKLTDKLLGDGHEVYVLSRTKAGYDENEKITYVKWMQGDALTEPEVDVIVNLAGASINARWTDDYKQKIIQSRLQATREVVRWIVSVKNKPQVLINASAIGFYGTDKTAVFTEDITKPGNDYLAQVSSLWESEAMKAEELGIRVVRTRFGIVLGKSGGALQKMVLPYNFFVGGKIGTGNQWYSWVHIDDVVNAICYCIENKNIVGAVNVTAPNPITMNEFGKTIAKTISKPHWLWTPEFALKIILGEMSTLVLDGQKVMPNKLLESGYQFVWQDLEATLKDILK